jgi:hypothetical protein
VSGEATALGVMLMLWRVAARTQQHDLAPPNAGSPPQAPPALASSRRRRNDGPAWGENAPLFVRRRRAWLHAVLSGAEPEPRRTP